MLLLFNHDHSTNRKYDFAALYAVSFTYGLARTRGEISAIIEYEPDTCYFLFFIHSLAIHSICQDQ